MQNNKNQEYNCAYKPQKSTRKINYFNGHVFGSKRDKIIGDWRKLHNEKLHNLYSSPNMIRMIKSRRMRREGHAASVGEKRDTYKVVGENHKERDHKGDLDVGGKTE
jgi:hypothetical protein